MQGRIICFTDNLGSGGAQRQMVGLACMLKERDYDVSVVLYHDTPFYKPMLDNAGIESVVVKNTNYISRIWAMYKYFRKNKGATIIAYQETPSLIACLLRPFIRCRKLIVSERNTTQTISRMDKLRFWLYRFADHIVPNSYSQADFICKHYPRLEKKVTTITNFVDTEYFCPANENGFFSHKNTLSIVASHKPEKNFDRFVRAIKLLENDNFDLEVNWFGIRPAQLERFKQLVKSLGLSSVINVHGLTKDVKNVYNSSSCFCLPSLYEGFPNVLCEAMSCGLPVVCSNVCDHPYILQGEQKAFLFNPNSEEDIAQKLRLMMTLSERKKQELAKYNRQRAVSLFSKDIFIEKYIKLL